MEVLAESVVDGKRNDEGRDTGRDSGDGDARNYANDGLAPLGTEIAGRDEEFEADSLSVSQSVSLSALFISISVFQYVSRAGCKSNSSYELNN